MNYTEPLISPLLFGVILVACRGAEAQLPQGDPNIQIVITPASEQPVSELPLRGTASQGTALTKWVDQVPQIDEQGAVTVEITPLNPNDYDHTLDFLVALNTHSVDLSMDLSQLAVLTTNTGHQVDALQWDAPLGGHHVRGTLSFPAVVDGAPLLDGVTQFTLTLVDLDAPQRAFVWER